MLLLQLSGSVFGSQLHQLALSWFLKMGGAFWCYANQASSIKWEEHSDIWQMNLVAFVTVSGSVVVCVQLRYQNITEVPKWVLPGIVVSTPQRIDLSRTSGRSGERQTDLWSTVVQSTTYTVLFRSCCHQHIILLLLLAQHLCVNNQLTLEFEHALNRLERDFSS